MAELNSKHAIAFGLLAGAGILFYAAHNMSGGSRPPKFAYTEDASLTASPYVPLQPEPELGWRTTQHRFPHRCGHEISTLIERQTSPAGVPRYLPEAYMIEKPPSELVL